MMTAYRPDPMNPTHDNATRGEGRVSPSTNTVTHELTEASHERQENNAKSKRRSRRCLFWIRDGDGIERGWKPFSLTAPVLICLAVLSLLIAAAIETLAQRSSANGGLALAPTLDDIPQWPLFASKYVPNIVAALYSLMWNWVDLDVKRMQPWFELSRPGGSKGEDSLFLDYPCEFVAFVPWRAAKKRHWPVFLSGTTVMIVFWAITPFQSAIFGTGAVQRTENVNITSRSELLPVSQQARLDSKALMTGYSIGWLGQKYPPFMTADYALLPFNLGTDPAPIRSEANWTATTTKLSTELTCWPANISKRAASPNDYYFLNGQGCNATISVPPFVKYSMYYIGYYSSPFSDFALSDWNCPKTHDSIHQFLAIWRKSAVADPATDQLNMTALYCQPQYYKQKVMVTVSADSLTPHDESVQPVTKREPLTDSEFNSTVFEYLLANAMPIGGEERVKDKPFNLPIEPGPRLSKYQLRSPASNMVGFALAGQNLSMDAYSQPKVLEEAFNRAHKYLFSVAVSQLLVNETTISNHTALSSYPLQGILVSRVFSAVVESLLAASAILTIALLWLCYRVPCHLRENPNSISRLIDIFRNSADMLGTFRKLDNADDKSLFTLFRNDVFKLSPLDDSESRELRIERVVESDLESTNRKLDAPEAYYAPVRPFALTRKMGLIFLVILSSAIAVIAWLKAQEVALDGLRRPTTSFEVLQLLENYLPMAFSSLVEPFWVLLNRLLCVMQPFQELRAGKALPGRSIDTTYSAIPPQLSIWRAIKARHFLLVIVCITTLAANLLGIGLGALFNESDTTARYRQELKPISAARFSNESVSAFINATLPPMATTGLYQDHFYVAMANISDGTPLPPWVTPDYFFLPHTVDGNREELQGNIYNLQTRGFGASLECKPIPSQSIPSNVQANATSPRGQSSTCLDAVAFVGGEMRQQVVDGAQTGPYAFEYGAHIDQDNAEQCDTSYAMGWGRTPGGTNQTGPMQASYAICEPIFETAMFDIDVDASGNVLSYKRTSEIKSSLEVPHSDALVKRIIMTANLKLSGTALQVWHNDTLTRDWLNYLMMVKAGSRDFLDPTKPVPDPTKLIPYASDIYRRLFAILVGINQNSLFEQATPGPVAGTRSVTETRIFLDRTALVMTLTVLSINVAVTVLFYARAAVFVLPRMPTNIGSILAYVAPSRAVTGLGRHCLGRHNRTYSFGRFLAVDGSVHIGIEMDPHVVPIDPSSVRKTSLLRRIPGRSSRRKKADLKSGHWL